ncbi:geranylgeranyl pyrophosphate synthetase [Penicillium macrosclerotiorum]|uniref:geranylgeranyl pyrophosphate synthetase n=1 Tax=Penicillium macrosclerotiorum TaxID=303699 RepID=UPI002549597A|nr:geranylgeranyl pyrophosphate synthetase [Penicillium macrosclerotiorum]KAJ5662736.1 geranylgeranyl pyrophosphate synthetase [Penicillium macrosclerotiorum]
MPHSRTAFETVEISRWDRELSNSTSERATITDVKHLASYNWIDAPTPTIVVPGCPPYWFPPKGAHRLQKDTGLIYIDRNAALHPNSPLEPLFRSLYLASPSFDINAVDIVTDRNIIRKLLSFVNSSFAKNGLKSFTIQVEINFETAIFCREEIASREVIEPEEFRGYGHGFEKAYTKDQIPGSTAHHRIISYQLAGLKFLVRHETDGYVDNPGFMKSDQSIAGLGGLLESLSLSSTTTSTVQPPARSQLTIKNAGRVVPRASTLELKTRAAHKPFDFSEVAPQIWISQTPKLVRAYHNRGTFSDPDVEDVAAAIKEWEWSHQDDIKKLVALLNWILKVARSWGGSSIIRYDDRKDKLVIMRTQTRKMLPDDLYKRWTRTVSTSTRSED